MTRATIFLIPIWYMSLIGCVSQEGIGYRYGTFGAEELVKYGALPDAATEDSDKKVVTRLVIIGYTSAYRPIQQKNVEKKYAQYMKFFETWDLRREPVLGPEEFVSSISGWSKLKTFSIPGILGNYQTVLVPRSLENEIKFVGEPFFQTTGDLAAAHTNDDGVYILSTLLCKDETRHSECAVNYKKGTFDSTTGQELDGKLRPKKTGLQIDPITLQKMVQKDTE